MPRRTPVLMRLPPRPTRRRHILASRPSFFTFALLIAVVLSGTGLLMLPLMSRGGLFTSFTTALFTATSAVSTTGLTVVTTAEHWSFWGQFVILALMFLGGLGFMTLVTVLLMIIGHRFRLTEQMVLRESYSPTSLEGILRIARHVLVLDLVITAVGIAPLFIRFNSYFAWPEALWQAVFHSVSAFNTAGFDIVGPASLTPYRADWFILGTVIGIACLGALGYTALLDMLLLRRWKLFSLNTKLVLVISAAAWILGAVVTFVLEMDNPGTFGLASIPQAAASGAFNAVSGATTTGFSTIDYGAAGDGAKLATVVMMFIGGAAGSTAGGTKVNTLSVLVAVALATFRGRSVPQAFRREIPQQQVGTTVTILLTALALVGVCLMFLTVTEPSLPFLDIVFETVSAFGTVGLSTGALAKFSAAGIWVIIVLMFIGRIGVLTLILALSAAEKQPNYHFATEKVTLG